MRSASSAAGAGPALPPDSVVGYVRDQAGLVHRVWILTPEEAAERR